MQKTLALLLFAGLATGCRMYSPDAGHEIVLVKKPIIFGHGGVDSEPVKTGLTVAAITTQGVDVYMQPLKYDTQRRHDDSGWCPHQLPCHHGPKSHRLRQLDSVF